MRSRYLFDLAFLCNIPAPAVDALRFYDFLNYVLNIDAYWEVKKKVAKEGGNG